MKKPEEPLIKSRLTAWHTSRLHIFRHTAPKNLDRRQPACGFWEQSGEKSDGAICAPDLNQSFPKAILPYLVLVPFAVSVGLVLWLIVSGALLGPDETAHSLGGIFDTATPITWPLLPNAPTLQPLLELLLDTPEFFVMFWNTCALAFPQLIGQFFIAAPAAWAFSRFSFRGRDLLFAVYTVLMLLPFQVLMVPDYLVLHQLGLVDTIWSIVLPGVVSTFPVFIMKKGFDGIPASLLEAAELDGAGAVTTYLRIGLPLGVPGILSALLLSLLEAWNALEQPLVFLKDKSLWPLSLFLAHITQEDLGLAMVASVWMLLPILLIFLFGQRYLILGIQSSGLKE